MGVRLALRYDMRAPAIGAPADALYPAAVEQCAIADAAGFDTVYIAEHHGAEDGYCPAPMILASAIAGRTSRTTLHFSALIAVLHDPLRLAEDLAVLDLISGGRIEMTVRPRPIQRPRPPIYIGGSTEASAIRAARYGDRFMPATPDLYAIYADERRRLGRPVPDPPRKKGPLFLFVTPDPEKAWDVVAPHVLYTTNSNAEWAKERGVGATPYPPVENADALKGNPQFAVVTPDDCVALVERLGPDTELTLHPLMGGLDPSVGTASLELFVTAVLPALEARGLWTNPLAAAGATP
jgi:alkanesulfonate monooxygenase SsuD/methylene tetrahydromethanopterin reductase-like flavin-dependent oxidoreductase (luciferase family)